MNHKTFAHGADGQVQSEQNQNQNWENVIMFYTQTFIRFSFFSHEEKKENFDL